MNIDIIVGKHSVVIPPGTRESIASALSGAGIRSGQWKALLSGFVKGTPHTPEFRVRSVDGRAITIRVHPGGNHTCTQYRLIVPNDLNPRDVYAALANLAREKGEAPTTDVGTIPGSLTESDAHADDLTEVVQCKVEDVLNDPTLLDVALDELRQGPTFSRSGCTRALSMLGVVVTEGDSERFLGHLQSQRLVEPAPHDEELGFQLTRLALERIGAQTSAASDDIALQAGVHISQLRADAQAFMSLEQRRDELVAEHEDLCRRQEERAQQIRTVEETLERHPGRAAAEKWKHLQQLMNLPD